MTLLNRLDSNPLQAVRARLSRSLFNGNGGQNASDLCRASEMHGRAVYADHGKAGFGHAVSV